MSWTTDRLRKCIHFPHATRQWQQEQLKCKLLETPLSMYHSSVIHLLTSVNHFQTNSNTLIEIRVKIITRDRHMYLHLDVVSTWRLRSWSVSVSSHSFLRLVEFLPSLSSCGLADLLPQSLPTLTRCFDWYFIAHVARKSQDSQYTWRRRKCKQCNRRCNGFLVKNRKWSVANPERSFLAASFRQPIRFESGDVSSLCMHTFPYMEICASFTCPSFPAQTVLWMGHSFG